MLNYLYENFLEEEVFVAANGTTGRNLRSLVDARVFPAPSYLYKGKGQLTSFVGGGTDDHDYRFHLKGHTAWFTAIAESKLVTEDHARTHFFDRYNIAKQTFFASTFGQQLCEFSPKVEDQFDVEHESATWNHFLNGVYGVCTRDGQPETIFKKQAGVLFIDQMITGGPASLSCPQTQLLERAVGFLDTVESDFAPHEVAQTSRQRCISDVRTKFLGQVAA